MKLKPLIARPYQCVAVLLAIFCCPGLQGQEPTPKSLIAAAQRGNFDQVKAAIDAGVDVNSKSDYGATPLFFACDRGNRELVKYLLAQGADPNVKDTFYNATPVTWAQSKGDPEILRMLFAAGADGAEGYLLDRIFAADLESTRQMIESKSLSTAQLVKARAVASQWKNEKQKEMIQLFAGLDLPEPKVWEELKADSAQKLAGTYRGPRASIVIESSEDGLRAGFGETANMPMSRISESGYLFGRYLIEFEPGDPAEKLTVTMGTRSMQLTRGTTENASGRPAEVAGAAGNDSDGGEASNAENGGPFVSVDMEVVSKNWPGFRGVESRGIADGQQPPMNWHVAGEEDQQDSQGVVWKTPVEGLGMSCPSIWEDRVFVTTASAEGEKQNVKIGLYGDVASVEDDREYQFKVICLSKSTGEVLWERIANQAKPAVKRHAKSSHANPTVATDGSHVVAFFGSEGLYCYDTQGNLKWKLDLGLLDSGWFYDPGYQWGFGSSPVIYEDRVIVQCDIQGQSFIAAYRLSNGEQIWRQDREEIPTWSTPTIHRFGDTVMVITNGTKAARGYDVADGRELWSLKGHSEIVVPTPSVAHNLIFVASGYSPIQPIYAIRPSARGDISLEKDQTSSEVIDWSVKRGGPYMPTPIVYGDYLYCCANNGILSCYDAKTGQQKYRTRMKAAGGPLSFTASPIAADGNLYCTAEDGRVLVVKAGPKFKLLTTNQLNESVLATPAISEGRIFFRTQQHVIAIGN